MAERETKLSKQPPSQMDKLQEAAFGKLPQDGEKRKVLSDRPSGTGFRHECACGESFLSDEALQFHRIWHVLLVIEEQLHDGVKVFTQ